MWRIDNHLYLFDQLLQNIVIFWRKTLHIRHIYIGITLTIRTYIFVDMISFRLHDTHATSMKPVLASITAYIKPETFVTRKLNQIRVSLSTINNLQKLRTGIRRMAAYKDSTTPATLSHECTRNTQTRIMIWPFLRWSPHNLRGTNYCTNRSQRKILKW